MRSRAWLGLAALLGGGALAAAALPGLAPWLDWQPALAARQPWRWFSAAFVHLSSLHLGANLLGTLLVAALGRSAGCDRTDTLCWALAWPLTHLALLGQVELRHYAGLSGVLHAGVAVAAVRLALVDRGARRAIGLALLAGLAAKIALEAPWRGAVQRVPGWDIPIAPLAHASGAFAGALLALLRHRRPGPRNDPPRP